MVSTNIGYFIAGYIFHSGICTAHVEVREALALLALHIPFHGGIWTVHVEESAALALLALHCTGYFNHDKESSTLVVLTIIPHRRELLQKKFQS